MDTFVEILGCDGTALYQAYDHNMQFKSSGRLQILIAYDGMLMFKLNEFQYHIKQTQEILCERNDPQFQMVLYFNHYEQGKWVFKINEHADEVYSCLNQKCYIKERNNEQSNFSSEQSNQKVQLAQKPQSSKQKKEKKAKSIQKLQQVNKEIQQLEVKSKSITAKDVVVGASKGIGLGLAFTGKVLSKGFEAVGSLTSKVVKPTQKVEVSQNAKANIQLAKKTSKSVLTFTATQVGNFFRFGKQTVSHIGERFEKTDKGKQLQQNQKYSKVKEGTKTGVQVFSNIYEGVATAVYEMGSGISKGTSKIVSKKYGDQAGQAADDMFEGVGNVIKISRVPQDQAAATFK